MDKPLQGTLALRIPSTRVRDASNGAATRGAVVLARELRWCGEVSTGVREGRYRVVSGGGGRSGARRARPKW